MVQTAQDAMARLDWSAIERELDAWEAEGLTLPVWWRDDDAVEPTEPLERLLERAEAVRAPIAIASIPTGATAALAERLARDPRVCVLIHGWRHVSHAPAGEKKAEFGAHRPVETMREEAAQALETIERVFDGQMVRCFVPPWNRVAPEVVEGLAGLGYRSLSTFTPRSAPEAAPGLAQLNTHVDPIDFGETARLKDPGLLARRIAEALRRRRMAASGRSVAGRLAAAAGGAVGGRVGLKRAAKRMLDAAKGADLADNAEPFGLLTHHLVHDAAIWRFVDEWLALLARRSAVVRWVDLRTV